MVVRETVNLNSGVKKVHRVLDLTKMAKEASSSNGHRRASGCGSSKRSRDDRAGPGSSSRRGVKDKKSIKVVHTMNIADKNKTNNKSSATIPQTSIKVTPFKVVQARMQKLRARPENRNKGAIQLKDKEKQELEKLGYILSNVIGQDATSVKYRAHWLEQTQDCALRRKYHVWCKVVDPSSQDVLDDLKDRELKMLLKFSHPNVAKLHSLLHLHKKIYVFTTGGMYGSTMDFLSHYGPLKELHARVWFRQILNGLEYLHGKDISHGDLNCETLMLRDHYNILIGDFGHANRLNHDVGKKLAKGVNKSLYTAPEILLGGTYNPKMADMWSLGIVLFAFFMGHPPFAYHGDDDEQIAKLVIDQMQMIWFVDTSKKLSLHAWKVMCALLEPDVLRRANLNFLKQSQFYSMKECVCGYGSFKALSTEILRQLPDIYTTKTPPKGSTPAKTETKSNKIVCPVFKEFFSPRRESSLKIEDADQHPHVVINVDDCMPYGC